MRLVVGCTLDAAEVDAIERGEDLRDAVERKLVALPLAPPDGDGSDALELLSWMVAKSHLDVKVAVPCDGAGRPVADQAIFHEKSGIIEDKTGERIAWTGSLNETAAGWRTNWETINVFRGWSEAERVDEEERNFARIWSAKAGNGTRRLLVLDVNRVNSNGRVACGARFFQAVTLLRSILIRAYLTPIGVSVPLLRLREWSPTPCRRRP